MREKKKLLFVISQFYKGGAEVALLNLFNTISPEEVEIDFLIFDQIVLPNAHSLIKELPEYVNVCNAAEREGKFAIVNKVINKVWMKLTKKQRYRKSAYRFVRGRVYDYAISVGEWMSPEFVAKKVVASKKAVWIHTDIDKASYVDPKVLFGYDDYIDRYIFVSQISKESAEQRYRCIQSKSVVINNILNDAFILKQSTDEIETEYTSNKFTILTVANLRSEKNHLRQIEAMNILKSRGISIRWLNIGSEANLFVHKKVLDGIKSYGLEDDFLLLGVRENPYRYMSKVDAVAVLSDFESWSMVITEAKIVGTPVVATKTSGALEQIKDCYNGLLTEFDAMDIANQIQRLYEDKKLYFNIKSNLKGFSSRSRAVESFYHLLEEQ